MTTYRRFTSIMLVCMLMFTIVGSVAEDNLVISATGTASGISNTIEITKTITVTNTDTALSKVNGPNVTYTYQIAPVTTDKTVTDAANHSIHVLSGIGDAINETAVDGTKTITLVFNSAEVTLNQGKGEVSNKAKITFDPTKFSKPGIYRYSITDTTTNSTLWNAGILRHADYKKIYYLDVYVGYKATTEPNAPKDLEIQGYAFFNADADITASDEPTHKLGGFLSNDPSAVTLGNTPAALTGDLYPTFNVEITQEVSGSMADGTHQFPVEGTISNVSSGSQVNAFLQAPAATETSYTQLENTTFTVNISSKQTIKVCGLNILATITAKETNTTSDTYTISAFDASKNKLKEETKVESNAFLSLDHNLPLTDQAGTVPSDISTATVNSNNTLIRFVNHLDTVSPTGIVRHMAPYALMLMFAFFFVLLLKRRKEETAEE